MPIRRSPNDARHPSPQAGRDPPEQVVAINRNAWSQSIGTAGRDHPVRAEQGRNDACRNARNGPVGYSGNYPLGARRVAVTLP